MPALDSEFALIASNSSGQEEVAGAYDVQTFFIQPGDYAVVEFTYNGSLNPRAVPVLQYFDPAANQMQSVHGSILRGINPITKAVEPGFPSIWIGPSTVTVVFDVSSIPSLGDLTGTVFIISVAVTQVVPDQSIPFDLLAQVEQDLQKAAMDVPPLAAGSAITTGFIRSGQLNLTLLPFVAAAGSSAAAGDGRNGGDANPDFPNLEPEDPETMGLAGVLTYMEKVFGSIDRSVRSVLEIVQSKDETNGKGQGQPARMPMPPATIFPPVPPRPMERPLFRRKLEVCSPRDGTGKSFSPIWP